MFLKQRAGTSNTFEAITEPWDNALSLIELSDDNFGVKIARSVATLYGHADEKDRTNNVVYSEQSGIYFHEYADQLNHLIDSVKTSNPEAVTRFRELCIRLRSANPENSSGAPIKE
jgi:hypothetical protein